MGTLATKSGLSGLCRFSHTSGREAIAKARTEEREEKTYQPIPRNGFPLLVAGLLPSIERKIIMKRSILVLGVLGLAFTSSYVCGVHASEIKYGTPWTDTDKSLYNLINEGYSIVGSSFSVVSLVGTIVEVIYLQKGKKVYRCITTESKESTEHVCTTLTEPKKIR